MSYLILLPELVLNEILKNLDFREVQTLRKVCHDLRDFIDDHKPDAKINAVELFVREDHILVKYQLRDMKYHVEYREFQPEILWRTNRKVIHSPKYVNSLLTDLAIILSFQNSTVNKLSLYQRGSGSNNYSKTLEGLTSILSSRNTLLKTNELVMDALDEHHLLSILPYLISNALEAIEIRDPIPRLHSQKIELQEVIKLKQWRKAKEVRVLSKRFSYRLEHFEHFSSVTLQVDDSQVKQLEGVMKLFLRSSTMNCFCFNFSNFEIELLFLRTLGLRGRTDNNKKYFRIKDSSDILEIDRLITWKRIRFARLSASEAPKDIFIRD